MKLTKISTEDPILTAYALGELDASEAARVAAAIAHNPDALQVVNEIRATAQELHAALKDEPIFSERVTPFEAPKSAKVFHFPYYAIGSAAAACFAAILGVNMARRAHPVSVAPVAPITIAPGATIGINAAASDVAISNRLANVIPDGFSDLKPAPFRDSGYRLGKSIAATDAASASTTEAAASKVVPAPANSPSTSALASDDSTWRDEPPHQLLSLKSPALPVIDVAQKSDIPFVNPRALAFSSQEVKFTGLPDFRTLLKGTSRGATYDEVLSWSTQDTEKKEQATHRTDLIDLVKKPKNATVE